MIILSAWLLTEEGRYGFQKGKDAWEEAAQVAARCPYFQPDEEEEQVADEKCSCYNCRYRRWTQKSFLCLKL
ncbi:MAG: hypothetical protein PHP87_04435 [Syntrophomonas sp.]|uniref:hypothetical protein n=1 Tax=Syntrophomonas sp. TaxID=2053627 RepID=UPI00260E7739|nr:hypothetical protein [Syntrophomonas sp.]MDD4626318.1 hypothetical protein [Syntrophomonas sp.]